MQQGNYRIAGIDISTKTGLAIINDYGDVFEARVVTQKPAPDRIGRFAKIASEVAQTVRDHAVDFAVIEGYGYANAHTMVTLVEVGTLVRYFLRLYAVPCIELPPTSLKKFVTGKGNAQKAVMLLETYKRFGFETDDDNIADAFCLAKAGVAMRGGLTMPKAQMEALDVVKKSQPDVCNQLQILTNAPAKV